MLSEKNYTGNIIVNLASLPDFLREPILKKRMMEFFSIPPTEKVELINNALEAGPSIPFLNFSKLFKTWLEILSSLPEQQRNELFFTYINEVIKSPQKLINFNLDGIFEIFISIDPEKRKVLSKTIKKIIFGLSENQKKRLRLIIPDNAQREMGI